MSKWWFCSFFTAISDKCCVSISKMRRYPRQWHRATNSFAADVPTLKKLRDFLCEALWLCRCLMSTKQARRLNDNFSIHYARREFPELLLTWYWTWNWRIIYRWGNLTVSGRQSRYLYASGFDRSGFHLACDTVSAEIANAVRSLQPPFGPQTQFIGPKRRAQFQQKQCEGRIIIQIDLSRSR